VSDLASWADTVENAVAPRIARFNATCQQWYHADNFGIPTAPIPGATGPSYTFLPPVPCGNFIVRAFDAGHIPYDCRFAISGDCQP
jgi:hypothetical protein